MVKEVIAYTMTLKSDQISTKTVHGGVAGAERRGQTQPMGFKTVFLVEINT